MKTFPSFCRGSRQFLWSLGTALLCSAGCLQAQDKATSVEWPRSYTVDDDDVVIYQPKIEKWDQKFVVARFAVGVKGKNDEQPIYGSFLAKAETQANLQTRMVSISNFTVEDFKFADAGNRLEHIKRDIAAVSPEKPLNVPMDELVASVPAEDSVSDDDVAGDETARPEKQDHASKPIQTNQTTQANQSNQSAPAAKKIQAGQPLVLNMEKGVAPQGDISGSEDSQGTDEEAPVIIHSREIKKPVIHDPAPHKVLVKRSARKEEVTSQVDRTKEDSVEEAPRVIRVHQSIPAPTHSRTLCREEPRPHVVHHIRAADGRFGCFEKKVCLGTHGEVVHHSVKHRIVRVKRSCHEDGL